MNILLNKVDRMNSNLHGASDFLNKKEMDHILGAKSQKGESLDKPFTMKGVEVSEFNGFIVNSQKINGDLHFHAIEKQHGCIFGTPGTGKSTYALGPTIQACAKSKRKPSLIINDTKGELAANHIRLLRDSGYNCIVLNLREPRKSLRFNPLDIIWDMYQEYEDSLRETPDSPKYQVLDKVSSLITEIAMTLCPADGGGDQQTWQQGAQGLIKGIIWGMLEDGQTKEYGMTKAKFTFSQFSNILNRQGKQLQNFLTERPVKSKVWDYAAQVIDNKSEKTLAGYLSSTQTALQSFLEDGILYITSGSDFDLSELPKKPTALFLIIPDEDKSRYVLANLMICQLYNYLTYTASMTEAITLDRTFYFMLDEFGQMPKIPQFPHWISTSRSRNIFFFIILQALSQLKIYGDNESKTILQNCHLQLFLGASELDTLKYFQEVLGTYTVAQRSSNISSQGILGEYQGNLGSQKKYLVELDELQKIGSGDGRGKGFFTLQGHKHGKVSFVPVFDEELNKNGTFKKGAFDFQKKSIHLDFYENYYDILVRHQTFLDIQRKQSKVISGDALSFEEDDELDFVETTNQNHPNFRPIKELTPDILKELGIDETSEENDSIDEIDRLKNKISKPKDKGDT